MLTLKKLAPFILISSLASVAAASTVQITVPREVSKTTSAPTRAEILAERHIRRLSGLEDQERLDRLTAAPHATYFAAKARYEAMLASAEYPQLVARLAEDPKATVSAR